MGFKRSDTLSINFNILKFELAKYDNLPLHLAVLYLSLTEGNSVYFAGLKISSKNVVCNSLELSCDIVVSELKKNRILDGGLAAVNIWVKSMGNKRSNTAYYNKLKASLGDQSMFKIDINTRFSLKPNGNIKHKFIYARNSSLKSCIRNITMHYSNQGYVPKNLIFPFLYFHKHSELRMDELRNNYTLYKIKYDHVNQTLKCSSKTQERSTILTEKELPALYGLVENEEKVSLAQHISEKYMAFLDKKDL